MARTVDRFRTFTFKLSYISRAVGIPTCFAVSATHYLALDVPWYLWLPPLYHGLVHPHLLYWGARRTETAHRQQLEFFSMYAIEAVLVGHYLVVMQFGLWPSFIWFGGYAMNNLSFGGPWLTMRSAVGFVVGLLATGLVLGFQFQPETSVLTSVLCFIYMLFYTSLLANLLFAGITEMRRTAEAVEVARSQIEDKTRQLERAHGELEARNEQLQELDRQKTHFFQNISHELRTPLTLILNPLDELAERYPEDRDVTLAGRNARRLLRLVNQLLDFQKLAAGRKQVRVAPLDVVRFAWVAGDYFRSACSTREIAFDVTWNGVPLGAEAPGRRLYVLGQLDALEKVVFNFLSNALKFTPPGGRIELALTGRAQDQRVRISVTDSGPGIAEEDQGKLFKVFSQVDGSTTRAYEGSGLGLALAHELAHAMGGDIGVQSAKGEGSTFWVELPATADLPVSEEAPSGFLVRDWLLADASTQRPAPARESAPLEPEEGGGDLVLVVDDLVDMRELVKRTLIGAGYQVVVAPDGKRGLDVARKRAPSLIITDWMMPVMHGPALIQELKHDPRLKSTPVVLLTAKSDDESRVIGAEIGADAFLGKPFNSQELLSMVRNLLQLKEREREVSTAYSELKRAQAELVLAQKMSALGQLVAGVAHEINNPTNFVQSNFAVVQRTVEEIQEKLWALLPDDEEGDEVRQLFAEDFDTIQTSARHHEMGTRRIAEIVQSLLSFSRHDQAVMQRADLREIVGDTLVILGPALEGVTVDQDLSDLPRVTCNPSQLGQVFLNLVANAAYAAKQASRPEGPRVGIHASACGDTVTVQISDNGPGIDGTVIDSLFDPFVTTKPTGEGTGMGLAVSYTIVRDHGGELRARSEEEGAVFTMTLPVGQVIEHEETSLEAAY